MGHYDRNHVVIIGAFGVMLCALAGYIVTPSARADVSSGETKQEYLQRQSRSQAVYR